MEAQPSAYQTVNLNTLGAMLFFISIIVAAYTLTKTLLPPKTSTKLRILFLWHLFDALIHFAMEGSFLYNCFFTRMSIADAKNFYPALTASDINFNFKTHHMTPQGTYFLNDANHLYGSFYGSSATAKVWQVYAKADRRWGGVDLGVVSLELLTVFVMGPLAVWVCELLRRGDLAKAWFWMTVVATGELYGGFMTFAPEWLTGNPNLATDNAYHLWVDLVFFNTIWVYIPAWILYESYSFMTTALRVDGSSSSATGARAAIAGSGIGGRSKSGGYALDAKKLK